MGGRNDAGEQHERVSAEYPFRGPFEEHELPAVRHMVPCVRSTLAPEAHFVKAFSCIGNAFMVNPDFGGIKPTMFLCGNHEGAKPDVTAVLDRFGFDTEDMGSVEAARAIEPLCILWCIPGFRTNRRTHASPSRSVRAICSEPASAPT